MAPQKRGIIIKNMIPEERKKTLFTLYTGKRVLIQNYGTVRKLEINDTMETLLIFDFPVTFYLIYFAGLIKPSNHQREFPYSSMDIPKEHTYHPHTLS